MSQGKTVHFVRHCQTTWNDAVHNRNLTRCDEELKSEAYVDVPLTAFGEEQAMMIKQKILDLNAEVAITSPLKRTIETCIRTYGDRNVVATHHCAEIGDSICDIGTMKEDLVKTYPSIDFSFVPSTVWWYVNEKMKDRLTNPRKCFEWVLQNEDCALGETHCHLHRRIERFHEFIQNRNESNILVFSHSVFLKEFLFKYFGRPSSQVIQNGEIISYCL